MYLITFMFKNNKMWYGQAVRTTGFNNSLYTNGHFAFAEYA